VVQNEKWRVSVCLLVIRFEPPKRHHGGSLKGRIMSHGSYRYIPSLLFFLQLFEGITSFSTSPKNISFNRQLSSPTRGNNYALHKHRSKLGLAVDPNDFVNEMNHLHSASNHAQQVSHEKVVSGSRNRDISAVNDASFLVAGSLFGGSRDAYPIGETIRPATKQSYTTSGTPESGTISETIGRQFTVLQTGDVSKEPQYDQRELEFYTTEAVSFAKLPLAAVIYASCEFFFMNQKRSQDMYLRDEYDLDEEEEERAKRVEFVGTLFLRIGAAFALTTLTIALS